MKGITAIYLGRIVDKKHFRAFIYGVSGEKRLVNSWTEFETAMESGIWFAEEGQTITDVPIEKPKRRSKSKAKVVPVATEVKDDE